MAIHKDCSVAIELDIEDYWWLLEQATKASEECKSCKSDTSKQKEIKERELLQKKTESNGLLDKSRSITGLKKI